tara:strand:- start:862 stop:2175 length:1314 start_codon:yes stop_codon:yes gene_type:complete
MATCVILAAGKGTRMLSPLPKVLHKLGGLSLVGHVVKAASAIDKSPILVVGHQAEEVMSNIEGVRFATQSPQLGTGHAVMMALPQIPNNDEPVLVLFGDTPLIKASTLHKLVAQLGEGRPLAVLAFESEHPGRYGRVVAEKDIIHDIVEAKDATDNQLAIRLCNAGVMAGTGAMFHRFIPQISNHNAAKEYYLTDLVAMVRGEGLDVAYSLAGEEEVAGVNSQFDLSEREAAYQKQQRRTLMDQGVQMPHPETVFLSHDTKLPAGSLVEAHCVLAPGVKAHGPVTIRAFSHLEGAELSEGCVVGPYARLRPGTILGPKVRIGNFVETKKTIVGEGSKINHLSYVGDASLGQYVNIGAGTITCNYDGYQKHQTSIGDGVFVGSDTLLVAPINIGKGSYTGSGSVLSDDVPEDSLALTRPARQIFEGWATRFRSKQKKG